MQVAFIRIEWYPKSLVIAVCAWAQGRYWAHNAVDVLSLQTDNLQRDPQEAGGWSDHGERKGSTRHRIADSVNGSTRLPEPIVSGSFSEARAADRDQGFPAQVRLGRHQLPAPARLRGQHTGGAGAGEPDVRCRARFVQRQGEEEGKESSGLEIVTARLLVAAQV